MPSTLDVRFVDTPAGVTQAEGPHIISPPSFCGACLNFYCEKDSAIPVPRRPSSMEYRILIVLHFLGIYCILFLEKFQFVRPHRDSNYQLNPRGHRLRFLRSYICSSPVADIKYRIQLFCSDSNLQIYPSSPNGQRRERSNSCDDSRRHPAAYSILSIVSTAKIAYAIAKNPFLFYGYPGRLDILPMFLRYFSSFHFVGRARRLID